MIVIPVYNKLIVPDADIYFRRDQFRYLAGRAVLEEKVVLLMHLFLPELVYGSQGNAIDTRYVRPILECRDLDLLSLSNHSELSADLQRKLARARALYDSMNYGFEFDVRREIS